ncbi:MAG TPA: tyrosine-type recombinase/integrase, partial [Aestuariivirgaceae bacterium]|nr:tyrosine-type recombinase/integrase [Aestuariivirgaceae bacterium]
AAEKVGGAGGALVKMLMLTGQRRHETSMMRWRDLSGLENGNALWSIPGEVTKNHRPHDVPLAPEAVAVIRSLPIIAVKTDAGENRSEFVLTTTGRTPWSGFSKLKRQIDEQIAQHAVEEDRQPVAPWTMHDLRRSLVTGMNDRGIAPPHIIEAIVNHISGHRAGVAASSNVVPMRTGTNDSVEPATAQT